MPDYTPRRDRKSRFDGPDYWDDDRYYGRGGRNGRARSLGYGHDDKYDRRALDRSRNYSDRGRTHSLDRRPHHSSRNHRERDHHDRHGRRSHRDHSPRSRDHGNKQQIDTGLRNRKMGHAARAAIDAGVVESVRVRHEPGDWFGPKGARVATAALGAAVVDAVRDKNPNDHSKRNSVSSALGGLLASRLVNGPRKDIRR